MTASLFASGRYGALCLLIAPDAQFIATREYNGDTSVMRGTLFSRISFFACIPIFFVHDIAVTGTSVRVAACPPAVMVHMCPPLCRLWSREARGHIPLCSAVLGVSCREADMMMDQINALRFQDFGHHSRIESVERALRQLNFGQGTVDRSVAP